MDAREPRLRLGECDVVSVPAAHQGDELRLRTPDDASNVISFPSPADRIRRTPILDGLINEYEAAA